jgi:predicted HTH transcriptional regulator
METGEMSIFKQRNERWDYPLEALRKIVVNMIVHSDYTRSSDSMIRIFDDRIESFNPGRLMTGLSIQQLARGNDVSAIGSDVRIGHKCRIQYNISL